MKRIPKKQGKCPPSLTFSVGCLFGWCSQLNLHRMDTLHKGWASGFGIGTIAILLGILIFAAGLPLYRFRLRQGTNDFIQIIQVYVAAIRNRNLLLPEDPAELYEIKQDKEAAQEIEFLPHRNILRFLDRAAIQVKHDVESEKPPSPWKLCRVTQVENAKIVLSMIPIFGCTIIMTLCLAQLQTFSIQQGYTMDTTFTKNFQIPPASLPIIPIIFLIIIVPIYDRLFVPVMRKSHWHSYWGYSLAAHRSWSCTLLHFNGCGFNCRGEKEKSGQRPQHA
ncbi:hypothetical protein V8G54_000173 (mitochondrion) [Vigna mungo]|uniref:Uncharacterized protein n=1 Tax=Vigna mungo TaxID=3915 RepID=A0AAQ3SDY7_VIGMU